MNGFLGALGLVSLFLVGGECWAPGSVDSCPPGNPPSCPSNPVDDFDNLFNHPSDCHYFIHCDAGAQPICKECPAGLHFSPTLHVCDWPDQAGCESVGVDPTNSPPTESTDECTTPEHGTCEECSSQCKFDCPACTCEDERIAHPTECEWYYQCNNYVPELVKCPGGWHFNDDKKVCDCPCYAKCTVKDCPSECTTTTCAPTTPTTTTPTTTTPTTTTPTTTTPTTTTPTTTTPTTTTPTTTTPTTTTPTTTTPTTTTPTTTTPTTTTTEPSTPCTCPPVQPENEPVCPDSEVETYLPHPDNCYYYYVCSRGVATCGECPNGQHWNEEKNMCDDIARAGCLLKQLKKKLGQH